MGSNERTGGRVALSAALACVLVLAVVAPAAAAPRIFVDDADLESERVLVGEQANVTLHMINRGDAGALSVDIKANGSVIAEENIAVDANSRRNVTVNVTLDEPGAYEIRANDERAGVLHVTSAVAETAEEREDGRTTRIRAVGVDRGSTVTTVFEESSTDLAFASLTMTADREAFDRTVATYAPADDAPFPVPDDERSTVLGAYALEPVEDVSDETVTLRLNRSVLAPNDLSASEVTAYRYVDGGYEPVETSVVDTSATHVTYEANADGSSFVLGSLSPSMEVRDHIVEVSETPEGWQFELSVTVENVGPVSGEYDATMGVDDEAVEERTVTVESGETVSLTMQHVVNEGGAYDVTLNGDVVRTVAVSGTASDGGEETTEAESEDTTTGGESETDGEEATTEDAGPNDGGLDLSLPNVDEIGVRNVAIGASVAVLAGGVALIRRL